MSVIFRRFEIASILFLTLCAGSWAAAQDAEASGPPVTIVPNPDKLPQIVRLSLVGGDVRVSRGKRGEKATGAEWEKAEVNLPIEPGFSLATGKGLAEIEFEDASTMYLGADSAISFGELSSKAGVTHSVVELISGILTLNVYPNKGEWFKVRTPGDNNLTVAYPIHAVARLNRYLDATGLSPLEHYTVQVGKESIETDPGNMLLARDGAPPSAEELRKAPATFALWDAWVLRRIDQRKGLMAQAMKRSGLTMPLPGLQDLEGQGDFFDCAPYGRCWEPKNGWSQPVAPVETAAFQSASFDVTPAKHAIESDKVASPVRFFDCPGGGQCWEQVKDWDAQASVVAPTAPASASQAASVITPAAQQPAQNSKQTSAAPYEEVYFPCGPQAYQTWWPVNLQYRNPYPWQWVVCHSGSWIEHRGRYAWVAEPRRRHHPPLHWVNVHGKPAFVPAHPRDVKGMAPLNAKYGLFTLKTEPTERVGPIQRMPYDPAAPLKVLASAPKGFDKPYFAPLQPTESPRVEARASSDAFWPAWMVSRTTGTPITFDHKSQSFVMSHQETQGGKSVTVSQSLGGGPSATRGGGSSGSHGGGGYSGGVGSGGSAASHGGSGSSSGGSGSSASHAGGGSAPSGGGAGSGAASSGASHH